MTTSEHTPLSSPTFTHIEDYEAWAATRWIHPKGNIEAQHHARGKFNEETQELIDALSREDKDLDEIISEAGDVVWTGLANASNVDIGISESILAAFPGYFHPESPVTTADIDPLALTLFGGISDKDVVDYLHENARILGKSAKQWFNLRYIVNVPERTFADTWITLKKIDATNALTNTVLLVSYIAQHYADQDLATVLTTNHQKVEQRARTGQAVTKPPRPTLG